MMNDQPASSTRRVILYTRPGCHLCDEAKQAMIAANCADEYTLREINIESSGELLHKYRNDIPVVLINGQEAFRHRLSPQDFKAAIRRPSTSPDSQPLRPE